MKPTGEQPQRHFHYRNLVAGIVLVLVTYPFLEDTLTGRCVISFFGMVVAVLSVAAVSDNRFALYVSLALAVPALVVNLIYLYLFVSDKPLHSLESFSLPAAIVFWAYTTITIWRSILRKGTVNRNRIYGAIAVYLLLGMTWALGYMYVNIMDPQAFYVPSEHTLSGSLIWTDFFYYSFVSLTTLGFGDIVPVSSMARSMTILEAVTGVMFIATYVARLVGLYQSNPASTE